MLKFFFWILLLANAGLFAYQQGHLDALLPSGREPARVANQLNADKIRLIPSPDVAKTADAPVTAPASTPPSPPAAVPPSPPPVAQAPAEEEKRPEPKKPEVLACVEIGNFSPAEAQRFGALLAMLPLGDRVSQKNTRETLTHMVYIPPSADRESAEKKAAELKQLGVEEFFIIQDNSNMHWAISLGVFKTEEAALAHLRGLNEKGVSTARIGQRAVSSRQVAFQIRQLDASMKSAVEKIKAEFPKKEMRSCTAA